MADTPSKPTANTVAIMPKVLELDPDKEYYRCSCGKSQNQPFCDGSHVGTEFSPEPFKVKDRHSVWLCTCKHSKRGHLCDGSHNKLNANAPCGQNSWFRRR